MLTIPEVKEAFKMYVSGQLGIKVFRLLDCIAIGEVLNAFIDFRNAALSNYKPEIEKPKKIEKADKNGLMKAGVNRVYKEYKETGILQDNTDYIFDFLIEEGLLKSVGKNTPLLEQYYEKKIVQAKEELEFERLEGLEKAKKTHDPIKVSTAKELLSKMGIGSKELSNQISIRARKIVLREFFDKQIKEDLVLIFKV